MLNLRVIADFIPGLALSGLLALVAVGIEHVEEVAFGVCYFDALVVAILIGAVLKTLGWVSPVFDAGVRFATKTVLEVAIVLLGGTISAAAVADAGLPLFVAIIGVVAISLLLSYGVSRLFGLGDKLATLVSCGNSICGNSAIMAIAPTINASAEDVASSIAFTAALGTVVVLLLPLTFGVLGLTEWQYGVVAGLSVYAVPQVLAATVPIGPMSTQIGTMVKLVRVMMLGPVLMLVGLRHGQSEQTQVRLSQLVPWFIVGFLIMLIGRSFGIFADGTVEFIRSTTSDLTLVAMAGLGLSVNLRSAIASGGRVLAAGTACIGILVALAIAVALLLPQLAS